MFIKLDEERKTTMVSNLMVVQCSQGIAQPIINTGACIKVAKKKSMLLRIDPELWADLNTWAADELRSLNAQIEYILREAVRKQHKKPPSKT